MPPRSARLQYILLAIVMAFSVAFTVHGATAMWDQVFHGTTVARQPIGFGIKLDRASMLTPEATAAGLYPLAPILSVNGIPFTGAGIVIEQVKRAHPGDLMPFTYLAPDGSTRTAQVRLVASDTGNSFTLLHIITQDFILRLIFPIFCLALGCWVVLAKPHHPNAWLLLGIFNYFPSTVYPAFYWPGIWLYINPFWGDIVNTAGPFCIMLFGIYFSGRTSLDVRHPWLKWQIGRASCRERV